MGGLEKTAPLALDEVRLDNGCGRAMAAFNKAVTVVLERSEDVLAQMRLQGTEFLDAASTNEHEVIELNQTYGVVLPEPIVAVYPQDGSVMNTHPFAILDGAPWVNSEGVQAARLFREFLLSTQQQSLLPKDGFRPADPAAAPFPPDSAIVPARGANPQANLAVVEVPAAEVIDAIVNLWKAVRMQG